MRILPPTPLVRIQVAAKAKVKCLGGITARRGEAERTSRAASKPTSDSGTRLSPQGGYLLKRLGIDAKQPPGWSVTIDYYEIVGFPVMWSDHPFMHGGGTGTERMFGNGEDGPVCKCGPGGCACKPGEWAQTVAVNRFGFGTDVFDGSAVAAFWLDPILKHFAMPSSPSPTEDESLFEVEESVEPGQFPELDRHTMRPELSLR
ncbi:MAG: hypothetical protein ACYS0K_08880 [Planctomycetota bacterium]|jgi:hypothetical protein